MKKIDKLLDLFKAGEIELMWQLSKSINIDGVELWTRIYNEFKDHEGDLKIYNDWLFYHYENRDEKDYSYSLSNLSNYHDNLKSVILELIKYLDGELR